MDEDSDSDFDGYIDENDLMHDPELDDGEELLLREPSEPLVEQPPLDFSGEQSSAEMSSFTITPASSFDDPSSIPDYQEQRGCTIDMTDKCPSDFFHLFVTDDVLQEIVRQTNAYATQFLETADLPPKSRAKLWTS